MRRIVQLVGAVGRDQIFQRELGRASCPPASSDGRQLLGRGLIVLDGLFEKLVVRLLALLARLVQVVVAVAEVEIGVSVRLGSACTVCLVELGRLLVVLLAVVGLVGLLEVLHRRQLAHLAAADRRQNRHRHDSERRTPRQPQDDPFVPVTRHVSFLLRKLTP